MIEFVVTMNSDEFAAIRDLLVEEDVKDFTLLSVKAEAVLGPERWKTMQAAKEAGVGCRVNVKQLPGAKQRVKFVRGF